MVPSDQLPFSVIVNYDSWAGQFEAMKMKSIYQKTHFAQKEITLEELEDTLSKATTLMNNYRGKLALRDRKIVWSLIGLGIFALILAVIVGMLLQDTDKSPWFMTAFIIVVYLATCYGVNLFFKYRSSYEYRMS